MKIPNKSKEKKDKAKKKEIKKPRKEQVLIVAQEIKFARLLSGNEKKSRDKVLKTLKKWLLNCFDKKYEFKEDDFVRMWKGLFYAVWMSDKPLVQEELCESISAVLDLFPPEHLKHALLMFKAGLRVLATEWYGVDHHRMDKFLMLVRRYLRASLRCLLRSKWSTASCVLYASLISGNDGIFALKTPRYARNATSMLLHIMDCYLEEIAKVSSGEIPGESLAELLRPLCQYMCGGEVPAVCAAARRVLTGLLRQSEAGIHYQLATSAWQKMGCPEGGPEALELVSDDEGEQNETQKGDASSSDDNQDSTEKPLDPRAGRVNVELPLLPVPASLLADILRDLLAKASSKAHKRVRICLQRFEQLARDEYPLTIQTPVEQENPSPAVKPKKLARSLLLLEKKLVTASDELALRGLSRKHRKRLLAKSRAGGSIVEELEAARGPHAPKAQDGAWKVESMEPAQKEKKQDSSHKNRKRRNNSVDTEKGSQKKRKSDSDGDVPRAKSDEKVIKKEKNVDINIKNKSKLDKVHKKENRDNSVNNKANKTTDNNIVNHKVINEKVDKCISKENNVKNNKTTMLNGKTKPDIPKFQNKKDKFSKTAKNTTVLDSKVKNYQKQALKSDASPNNSFDSHKKVKFVLKNNSMQAPIDYYKSIRQSPNIPFDGTKKPNKTNLKPSTPSPINPFFKKKSKNKY